MFKKTFGCLIFLLVAIGVRAQEIRYDNFSFTTTQVQAVGIFTTVLAPSPQALIYVCAHPANGVPCTNLVQTYTDITGSTKCPTTAQLTPYNGNTCVGTADIKGNFGFWLPAGTYDYTVCPQGQFACLGPYPISISPVTGGGGGGGGSPGIVTFSGVSDAVKDTTCSVTSGSKNLTCTDGPFTTCPTGKTVSVTDGLTSDNGEPNSLITTFTSCGSSSTAVMAIPATRTTSTATARWGTDNGPALIAAADAPTTAGKIFQIPPGNYLVRTMRGFPGGGASSSDPIVGAAIDAYSYTTYDIMPGTHIYWIGPTGCSASDTACPFIDQGYRLFYIHDPSTPNDTWAPNGTTNVHIINDGTVEGDNSDNNGVGVPSLNQSSFAFWVGTGTSSTNGVSNITIDGVGQFLNLYGFSVHGIAGNNFLIQGLTHNHVAKGLNVNGGAVSQQFNTFNSSFGIETSGSNVNIIGNHFANSDGISIGGIGGGATCTGYVVSANTFVQMFGDNMELSQCPVGAIISNNSFDIPNRIITGGTPVAINIHDDSGGGDFTPTRDNLIADNTFYGETNCYAAIFSSGSVTGGQVFSGNHMPNPCLFGYVLEGTLSGAMDIVKNDSIKSTSTSILTPAATIDLQGPIVSSGGVSAAVGGAPNLTSTSWYTTPSGIVGYFGPTDAPGIPSSITNGRLGYTTFGSLTQTPVNTFWIAGNSRPTGTATVIDCKVGLGAAAGNAACALYDSDGSGGSPGTVLCQNASGVTAVANGTTTIPLSGCPTLVASHLYYTVVGFSSSSIVIQYDNLTPSNPSYFVGSVSCCTGFTSQTFGLTGRTYTIYLDVSYASPTFAWGQTYNSTNKIPATFIPSAMAPSSINNILYVDGVNFTTVQSAINALPATGGTVIIPCGTYVGPTSIPTGTHLQSTCPLPSALEGILDSATALNLTRFTYTASQTFSNVRDIAVDGITFDFGGTGGLILDGIGWSHFDMAVVNCASTGPCLTLQATTINLSANEFTRLYTYGGSESVLFSGNSGGTNFVADNHFGTMFLGSPNNGSNSGTYIDFARWCDSNVFDFVNFFNVNQGVSNTITGVIFNSNTPGSNVGVYNEVFHHIDFDSGSLSGLASSEFFVVNYSFGDVAEVGYAAPLVDGNNSPKTSVNGACTIGAGCTFTLVSGSPNDTFSGYRITNGQISTGTNIVYRCATAGATLPAGSLTINSAACGTTTDTGIRVR